MMKNSLFQTTTSIRPSSVRLLALMFVAVVMLVNSVDALAADAKDEALFSLEPQAMIETVANRTFDRIKREQVALKENPALMDDILRDELMPYIDYRFSAFKVLGRYARKAKPEELKEYVDLFEEYLVSTYSGAMVNYSDQTVEFAPSTAADERSDLSIRASIKEQGKPDIDIIFKLRKDRRSQKWLIYDLVAEGISLLSSKQSEYEPVLRKDGMNGLIELLKSQT
ncbi:phospholipid-binding protein MlaC [Ningiella sp. W23]|uniref:MlaC/ttg2D family ABC transporter substrate-binding protein n=1 Tax=Ningiella sp. W23 TaxID=3023715 RepID=UPI0037575D23